MGALILALTFGACQCVEDRGACIRDGNCPDDQVCHIDGYCLDRELVKRLGPATGTECTVHAGVEEGRTGGAVCRNGFCLVATSTSGGDGGTGDGGTIDDGGSGPDGSAEMGCGQGTNGNEGPLFGGASEAIADGADAVIVRWFAAADETAPELIDYLVWTASGTAAPDVTRAPALVVRGDTTRRFTGLTTGTTYAFMVRARDEQGIVDCNTKVVSATPEAPPSCIDFAANVQPIFQQNCVRCHSGADAPRNLHLDGYEGVLAGGLTGNEVVACQSAQSLLYMKISMDTPPVGVRMPRDGPPYLADAQIALIRQWIDEGARRSCDVPSVCGDTTAPTFAGLASATLGADGVSAHLCWSAATDDLTAADALVYPIYQATAPGGESFTAPPRLTSLAGATCVDVDGLTPGQEYCWVARARDAAGNLDANTVERCLTVPAASCADFATIVQPIFTQNCIRCHSGPTAPRNLHLDSYAGVLAGGLTGNEVVACQPSSSLLYQKISQATPPIGRRMPFDGPPYLAQVQIDTIAQWITEGARASCGAPNPCNDQIPPVFAGISSARAIDAGHAELCWSAATDDSTAPADLRYDVYESATAGGEDYSALPRATSGAGAMCVTLAGLGPQDYYCWVVRARDAAGNRDANVVERCLTMPALPSGCVEFTQMVQPILDANCTRCHSGSLPPQWLRLDSYEGIIAGGAHRSEVVACNGATSLLQTKISATPPFGRRMPFDGPPYLRAGQIATITQWINTGARRTCSEPSTCGDTTPPTFAGLSSATARTSTSVRVCWPAATDDHTSASSIRYDVYEATAAGGETFTQPPQGSVVGRTCTDVGVGPGTRLCFVVRARDLAGNASSNITELCATAPAANGCTFDYADVQPIFTARCTHCHSGARPPRFLDLSTYGGILAGGSLRREVTACNFATSLLDSKTSGDDCGRRMPFDGPPYLAPSERSRLAAWVGTGARLSCSAPDPCSDAIAPTFTGATAANIIDATTVEVTWTPATDATSDTTNITYDVYERNGGAFTFSAPASYAAPAGATSLRVAVPSGVESCFVVRARDLHGNRDTNTRAVCATPPGACVEYEALVQPIFDARCIQCHSGANPPRGIRWDTYAHAIADTGEVRACRSDNSHVIDATSRCDMPRDTSAGFCSTPACLTPAQQLLIAEWIDQGAAPNCPSNVSCGP